MSKEGDKKSFLSQSRRDLQKEMKRLVGENGLVLKNVTVGGRRTSLRLEPMMWRGLEEICKREGLVLNEVCNLVEGRRVQSSLTAAIRVFTLSYFRTAAQEKRGWEPLPQAKYPTIVRTKN